MKYKVSIKNKYNDSFSIESVDDYVLNEKDINDMTALLADEPVRKYITDGVMKKYGIATVADLAIDILTKCPKLWAEREELRFFIRNAHNQIVGMVGIDVEKNDTGELWYFKISSSPSFMLEAATEVLKMLKQESIKSLVTNVKPDNDRSKEILKRIGFNETGNVEEMQMVL